MFFSSYIILIYLQAKKNFNQLTILYRGEFLNFFYLIIWYLLYFFKKNNNLNSIWSK